MDRKFVGADTSLVRVPRPFSPSSRVRDSPVLFNVEWRHFLAYRRSGYWDSLLHIIDCFRFFKYRDQESATKCLSCKHGMFTNFLLTPLQRGDSITELKEQLDQIKASMSLIYWKPVLLWFELFSLLTPWTKLNYLKRLNGKKCRKIWYKKNGFPFKKLKIFKVFTRNAVLA